MATKTSSSLAFILLLAACVAIIPLDNGACVGANVQVDLSSGFNTAGIFVTGTTFLGTP